MDVPRFSTNDLSLSRGPLQDPTPRVVITSPTLLLVMTVSCSFLVLHGRFEEGWSGIFLCKDLPFGLSVDFSRSGWVLGDVGKHMTRGEGHSTPWPGYVWTVLCDVLNLVAWQRCCLCFSSLSMSPLPLSMWSHSFRAEFSPSPPFS